MSTKDINLNKVTIQVGPQLFEFESHDNWINTATIKFRYAGVRSKDVLCIDSQGRICTKGLEFNRADLEGAYPIRVYRKLLRSDFEISKQLREMK